MMTAQPLADGRQAAFRRQWPELWTRLANTAASAVPDRAVAEAQAALAARRQAPDAIVFADPTHCNLSPVSLRLRDDLVAWIAAHGGIESLTTAPTVDAAFLFVFGLGDGAALPVLLAETTARIVVLVETDPGLVRTAAESIDWPVLLAIAASRGQALRWIVETDMLAIVVQWDGQSRRVPRLEQKFDGVDAAPGRFFRHPHRRSAATSSLSGSLRRSLSPALCRHGRAIPTPAGRGGAGRCRLSARRDTDRAKERRLSQPAGWGSGWPAKWALRSYRT